MSLYAYTWLVSFLFCLFFVVAVQYVVKRPSTLYTILLAILPFVLVITITEILNDVSIGIWQPILRYTANWVMLFSALFNLLIIRWIGTRNYFRIPTSLFISLGFLHVPIIILNVFDSIPKHWISMHAGSFQVPIYRGLLMVVLLTSILGLFFQRRYLFDGYRGILIVIGLVNCLFLIWEVFLLFIGLNGTYFVADFQYYIYIAIIMWGLLLIMTVIYVYTPNFKLKKPIQRKPLEELGSLKKELEDVMFNQKAYRNPSLDLDLLSDQMRIDKKILSKVINQGYEMNFFDFVNKARIEEFINFKLTDNYHNYTHQKLAEKVGFHSKSSFNKAFKKFHGMTPTAYFDIHSRKNS